MFRGSRCGPCLGCGARAAPCAPSKAHDDGEKEEGQDDGEDDDEKEEGQDDDDEEEEEKEVPFFKSLYIEAIKSTHPVSQGKGGQRPNRTWRKQEQQTGKRQLTKRQEKARKNEEKKEREQAGKKRALRASGAVTSSTQLPVLRSREEGRGMKPDLPINAVE